uniref:MYND-type domain-containing protein n=1 Tax=Meloidogyne floridensis TaxID=298350 RepID=A0A915P5Y2_9BILA
MSNSVLPSSPVFFGIATELEPDDLYKLERQYLPLGKVGGFPAWLNPVTIPQSEDLECSVCHSPMAFLLQIYCTNSSEPPHAFHRVLYLFACRKGCANPNDSSNFSVFRCQLPRDNQFYSFDGPTPLPSTSSASFDPFFNSETFPKLCAVCGCRAGKRCSKCSKRMYCSRNHQIIDWQTGHREECGADEKDHLTCAEKAKLREKQGFTFKEYGIEMDLMIAKENENIKNKNEETIEDDINKIEEEVEDLAFNNFNKIIQQESKQILRYQRGGHFILATDFSSSPNLIPNCELCGGPRQFEFQLMPYLLSLIDIDSVGGQSLDWATLLIFTCKNSCQSNEYIKEFIFKQDFVVKGINLLPCSCLQFNIAQRAQPSSSMEVLSNLLHGLAEAIQVVSQQVDQIVERERRAEAERERLGEAERDVNPTPSSSSSEESREAATEAEAARSLSLTSDSDTNQTSETSSDVTVQTGTDSDSTHTELSRTRENAAKDQELDPYEVDQLLEAMRSQSRLSVPESDVISTRSARVRSPPPTEDEQSTAAVTRTVSALEWDDVSTARVAPSEENLLASSNSPAVVANPAGTVVPELPANNDDIPTAIEADK